MWAGRRSRRAVWTAVSVLTALCAMTGVAWAARSEVLFAEGVVVRLEGKLPEGAQVSAAPTVRQEHWDLESVRDAFGQDAREIEAPVRGDGDSAGDTIRLADGALVRLGANGAGFYMAASRSGRAGDAQASRTASECVEIARSYIATHGGLPGDAKLWSVREVVAVGLSMDAGTVATDGAGRESRRTLGHYVEFKHAVDGVPVDSPGGGDSIKVKVDPDGGVSAYGRTWRHVVSASAPQRTGISLEARDALASGLRTGGLATTKSRLKGVVRLKHARLVYLSGSRDADVDVLKPCWRFVLESGSGDVEVFVDAANGNAVVRD